MTNLLMGEHIASNFSFPTLNEFNIGLHAGLGKVLRKQIRNVGVRVQTTKL